jgi:conjugative transfer signal peptidase TraF
MTSGTSDDTHAHVARTRPAWPTQPGGRVPRARGPRSSLVLGVLVLAAVVSTRWVRLNLSPSVPVGVYRLARLAPPLARGTLVLLPVPASVQAWVHVPLLKPVVGVAGDLACTRGDTFDVNGEDYGPVLSEAHGKTLPRWWGCMVVRGDEVVVASRHPRSLDSRYFGPVPIAAVTAVAIPLWTWE